MKKLLLTGGTGFLGRVVVKKLNDQSIVPILLTRQSSSMGKLSGLDFINVQLNTGSAEEIANALQTHQVDVVFHLATLYGRKESQRDVFQANLELTLNVLVATAKQQRRVLLINANTAATAAYSFYAASKKSAEAFLHYFAANSSISIADVDIEYMYGPGDNIDAFVPGAILKIVRNLPIDCSPGEQVRDFIYVDDAAEALVTIARDSNIVGYEKFSLGTGQGITLKALLLKAKALATSTSLISFGAVPYRAGEMMSSIAKPQKLTDLGWKAKVPIDLGLVHTISELRGKS